MFGAFRIVFKAHKHWLKMLYKINIYYMLLSVVLSQSIAWNSWSCDVTMEAPTQGCPLHVQYNLPYQMNSLNAQKL